MNRLQAPLPRALTRRLRRALKTSPVVVLTGARQTGKSTLIRDLLGEPARRYRTLDDPDTQELAEREPDSLLAGPAPIAIDEVQRAPGLLLAIKRAVDRRRVPGKFLLTGSANFALMRRVSESLAGRATYLTLGPFTPAERDGLGGTGPWDRLLGDPGSLEGEHPRTDRIGRLITGTGFPAAARLGDDDDRHDWFAGYIRTYLERDLQSLAAIHELGDFRRLLRVVALRSGSMMNQAEMARDAGLSQATAHRYLNLLEASYLLHRVEPYSVSRGKRLVKTPRLYPGDAGLAAHLAGMTAAGSAGDRVLAGGLLESVVLQDLLAWREAQGTGAEILTWRTADGVAEVDFVIERAGRVWPVEVKSASRVGIPDARHLAGFRRAYGTAAGPGLLLYAGSRAERLGPDLWAMPLSAALGMAGNRRVE